jgi:hypothetical protein
MSSLLQVFFSPRQLFDRVDAKPEWVLPFVTVVVVTLVLALILLPTVIRPYTLEKLESSLHGAGEQQERIRELVGGPVLYVSSLASALFVTPAKLLIIAGVFTLVILPVPGEAKFQKMLSVSSYSALISVLGGVVGAATMIAKKSLEVSLSIGLFFPFLEKSNFLFRLLSQMNFFTIWSLVVFGIGLSVVGKMSAKRSWLLVFALWVVVIVLAAFLGALGMRFSRFR